MFTEDPCVSKDEFLAKVDLLIMTLELHQQEFPRSVSPLIPRFSASVSEAAQTA
jgi:hypothetical protein